MTSCDRATNLFGRAWDDELSVAEREVLELHFTACTSCRREYDEYARTLELVAGLPRPVVAEDFAVRVLAEAKRREAEHAHGRVFAWPWGGERAYGTGTGGMLGAFRSQPAFAIAAAFVVAIGIGAFVLSGPVLRGGNPGTVALDAGSSATNPSSAPAVPAPSTGSRGAEDSGAERVAVQTPVRTPPASLAREGVRTPARRDGGPADADQAVASATTTAAAAAADAADAAALDSLFDHTADIEFVLDPVKLKRERGRGYTPAPSGVRGEAASITF